MKRGENIPQRENANDLYGQQKLSYPANPYPINLLVINI